MAVQKRERGFIGYPTLTHYGDGGFRFAGTRHEGSALVINGAVMSWRPGDPAALVAEDLRAVLDADPKPELVLLGAGETLRPPPAALRAALEREGIALEVMATASACRVYHTLVGEGRRIAAALIAI